MDDPEREITPIAGFLLCLLGLVLAGGIWALQTPENAPWGSLFVAGQAVAFGAYAAALILVRCRPKAASIWLILILVIAVGLRVEAFLRSPDLSTDLYRYIWDGRVINAGINPYLYAPSDPQLESLRDPLWRYINFKHISTIYPPTAQILFAVLARMNVDPVNTFRLIFLLFDLATVVVLWRLLLQFQLPRVWLLAYAWHPLVIMEFAAGGHVDAVGICLLAIAFLLMPSSDNRALSRSAIALGLSIMTKGYGLLALPFLVRRYGWRYLTWVVGACLAVVMPFLGGGLSIFGGLSVYLRKWQENASVLLILNEMLKMVTKHHLLAAKAISLILVILLTVWLLIRFRSEGLQIIRDTFIVFAAALLLGGPVLPWYLTWTGEYEAMQRIAKRLRIVLPLTLIIIFVLLFMNFGSVAEAGIVLLSVPFAAVGSFWLLHFLDYNLSTAVWVGVIALAGVAAETGVVMIVYLDEAYDRVKNAGQMRGIADLEDAVIEGAVQRVRPKVMTVMAIMMGLLPIMWSVGTGADVMKRIAAPMIGGMISSTILTLAVIPAIYMMWKGREVSRHSPEE